MSSSQDSSNDISAIMEELSATMQEVSATTSDINVRTGNTEDGVKTMAYQSEMIAEMNQ